jgi:hypothetical protein
MTTSRFGRTNRRRFVASSALGGAAALTAGQLLPLAQQTSASAALAQDSSTGVPMFRGNAARTGEMPGPGPDDSNGVEAIWTFTVDNDTTDDVYATSSPAVVDGVVYIGSADRNLYALHATDGTEVWRFLTGDWIHSSPAVEDGVVYVGSSDTTLYALDAENGVERWRFATNGGISSSPAVVDGVVYVGSSDANLYAVNAEDGAERWQFATSDRISSSPAVVDGMVYVGSQDGTLYAIGAPVRRLGVGGTARVTETTALRGGPAPTAVERAELQPDTVVTITGEAVTTGDVSWWPVTVDETSDQGWVEASKLEPLTSGPEPTAAP